MKQLSVLVPGSEETEPGVMEHPAIVGLPGLSSSSEGVGVNFGGISQNGQTVHFGGDSVCSKISSLGINIFNIKLREAVPIYSSKYGTFSTATDEGRDARLQRLA